MFIHLLFPIIGQQLLSSNNSTGFLICHICEQSWLQWSVKAFQQRNTTTGTWKSGDLQRNNGRVHKNVQVTDRVIYENFIKISSFINILIVTLQGIQYYLHLLFTVKKKFRPLRHISKSHRGDKWKNQDLNPDINDFKVYPFYHSDSSQIQVQVLQLHMVALMILLNCGREWLSLWDVPLTILGCSISLALSTLWNIILMYGPQLRIW